MCPCLHGKVHLLENIILLILNYGEAFLNWAYIQPTMQQLYLVKSKRVCNSHCFLLCCPPCTLVKDDCGNNKWANPKTLHVIEMGADL